MEDTQREPRVVDNSEADRVDETRTQEAAVVLAARLLANPRRIRRN